MNIHHNLENKQWEHFSEKGVFLLGISDSLPLFLKMVLSDVWATPLFSF